MFKVVETFSGIGSQAKALENISKEMNLKYDIVHTVEWDINAIMAYCMIHCGEIPIEKYAHISDEEVTEFLLTKTLSREGKKPMTETSIRRLPMAVKRRLYAAIKETKNLISITDVKGEDIPGDTDLLTYSFPCQDLSLCAYWHGNKSGIDRDAHNRSGMLWEVERILKEMVSVGRELPRFLLMENVVSILSKHNEKDFNEWKRFLNELGYYNKIYRLNAENFGIPQHRERAYMISVLCKNDSRLESEVDYFFERNNLEECSKFDCQKILKLEDILRMDYNNNYQYRYEATLNTPNNTPSRKKIYENNEHLYENGKIKNISINTLTTKQDRNPNSGLIEYDSNIQEKAKWRYLTPRECFMLMGFEEEDYEKVVSDNPNMTKSRKLYTMEKLHRMAGNSIVVNVIEAIFSQIIYIEKNLLC